MQRDEHIKVLINALSSKLGDTALEIISKIRLKDEEIGPLSRLLGNSDPEVRKRAVKALASTKDPFVVDKLWETLAKEENEEVRKLIREVLRGIGLNKEE